MRWHLDLTNKFSPPYFQTFFAWGSEEVFAPSNRRFVDRLEEAGDRGDDRVHVSAGLVHGINFSFHALVPESRALFVAAAEFLRKRLAASADDR